MRPISSALLMLWVSAGVAQASDGPRAYGQLGLGLPSLVSAQAGLWVSPRLTVDAHAAWTVFNPLVGAGVSFVALEEASPKRTHRLTVAGRALLNPTLGGIRIKSHGEVLAASVELEAGYRLTLPAGLLLSARLGALTYHDQGLAVSPLAGLAVGFER